MPSIWIDALKEFNMGKDMWCIPRKGSDPMAKVKRIMKGEAASPIKKAETPKMIKEHERLTKVLEEGAKDTKSAQKKLAKEAKIQKKELKEMKAEAPKKTQKIEVPSPKKQ